MTLQELWNSFIGWVKSDGLPAIIKIVIALIILAVSFKIINAFGKRLTKRSQAKDFDKTISRTLIYVLKLTLKIIVVICLIGYVGIDTSGLTALVASLGVCVGLAVNGALSNLAGGLMIIITRPFKIDDFIEACGYSGTVEAINITQTKLRTSDNKVVYIPNGTLHSSEIINYSEKPTRRLELIFSIDYSEDFEKVQKLLLDICNEHELVLKNPAPFVRMKEHADSSINITTRVWVNSKDYWTVNFDLLEKVKKEFDKNNIEVPFNQLDVNIKNVNK